MKTIQRLTLCALFALCSLYAIAYDFSATNDDGVTIYYSITSATNNTCAVVCKDSSYNSYSGDVVIPDSLIYGNTMFFVTSIGGSAFYYCSNLTSVKIPDRVTSIGTYAFDGCSSLTEVTLPEGISYIEANTFYYCTSLSSINIPNNVTEIGEYAFYRCSSLTELTLPEGITYIEPYTFYYCPSLSSINIPNNVTEIGDHTFIGCSSLSSAKIGKFVEKIADNAFGYCSNLLELTCLNSEPPTCKNNTFNNVDTDNCVLYVPYGSKEKYSSADVWKDFINIGEVDGIESVSADDAEVTGYYTLDGKAVNTPQRGVNIVKYSDGSTKKVIVK